MAKNKKKGMGQFYDGNRLVKHDLMMSLFVDFIFHPLIQKD
jgi:hypothetical protein